VIGLFGFGLLNKKGVTIKDRKNEAKHKNT